MIFTCLNEQRVYANGEQQQQQQQQRYVHHPATPRHATPTPTPKLTSARNNGKVFYSVKRQPYGARRHAPHMEIYANACEYPKPGRGTRND
ncbi:MAG: hypothetical protein FJ333_00770 [Sphingomonadales bacterium]|nr:hypothetical protein [Sphingomonadales bacterium]